MAKTERASPMAKPNGHAAKDKPAIPDVEKVRDTLVNVRFSARDREYSMSVVKKTRTTIGRTNEFVSPVKCRKRDDHMEY